MLVPHGKPPNMWVLLQLQWVVPLVEKIAVIGAGKLGAAIGKRLVDCGYQVLATRRHRERLDELKSYGLTPIASNAEAARQADVIIIAVKPWDVESVATEISGAVVGRIVVSVAAGVTLSMLKHLLPKAITYRAMPNLGVEIGLSLTALAEKRGDEHDTVVERIFGCLGEVFWVPEKLMPAWTGVAGSGPGLLASIAEAILLASMAAGLPAEQGKRLVAKLFELTGRLLEKYGFSGLREAVATPGGTTIEGILVLEKGARGGIVEAFLASVEKARELEERLAHGSTPGSAGSG